MKRVMIESPFASEDLQTRENYRRYLEACIFDSLERGEAPFASHGFYTQWLKDSDPKEREKGVACGRAWAETADIVAFYVDYGMSPGMLEMLEPLLESAHTPYVGPRFELRRIPGYFDEEEETIRPRRYGNITIRSNEDVEEGKS